MKISHLFLTVLLTCRISTINAQIPLNVETNVMQPYPTQYSIWASEAESFTVFVANNSDSDFEFFIRTELIGTDYNNDEVYIRISEDYLPVDRFTLSGGTSMLYTSSDIAELYANLTTSDIEYSPNIPIEDINGELPAGEYRICTQAYEYNEDGAAIPVPLSPASCSDYFTTGQASIELVSPDEALPLDSEGTNVFMWTVNGIDFNNGGQYEYQLNIYEIDALQAEEESIYDLVAEGYALPFFSSEPVSDLLYVYDPTLGNFPTNPNSVYAAQVTVTNTGGIYFENDNKSNIMVYGNTNMGDITPIDDEQLTENQVDCFENCHYTLDGNTNLLDQDNPVTFEIGNFTMTDVEISSHNNDTYTGIGRIPISWLNNVSVKVNFSGIKINTDGRMISGVVKADKFSMPDYLEEAANLLNSTRMIGGTFGANAAVDLPVGIDHNIGGFNLTVAITDLEFSATDCYASTACNFHIPALGDDSWISLETTEICMHPGGFGNEFIMHMGPDRPINSHGDILVNIKGSESAQDSDVKQEACYLEMDCNGVKSFSVKAEVNFPKNMLVPDALTGIPGDGFVKGDFSFTVDLTTDAADDVYAVLGDLDDSNLDRGLHFLAKIQIDPFQVKGVPGWGFEMSEVWWDASEVSNVSGIIMPEGHSELIEGNLPNAWTGFYLKKGTIAMPDQIFGTEGRPHLDINHGIIDPTFSMNISINDLLSNNEGNIDGWGISMDSLFMTINQNNLTEGGFSGQLRFPLSDTDQYLRYTAVIGETIDENLEAEGLGYTFNVSPDSTITFPFMISEVFMTPDSYIEGGYISGESGGAYFDSFITGGVNMDTKLFSTREDYEGIEFQDFKVPFLEFGFKYHSSNGFSEAHFGLVDDGSEIEQGELNFDNMGFGIENSKESLSGLPISIKSFNIANDELSGGYKFVIEPVISLSPGETGFSAEATVEILSAVEFTDFKNIKLTGLRIPAIGIDIERMGMGFAGSLEVYNDKDASGVGAKGVRGNLSVALPLGVGMEMAADFGSICTDSTAIWNTEKNFPYWYFDGMIYFGENGGIPIAGPIGLYGIGGGIQYNMSRSLYRTDSTAIAEQLELINVDEVLASGEDVEVSTLRRTTQTPVPAYESYGLKMAGTIGTCPSAALVNMDVSILAEFRSGDDMALSLLSIDGDAFLMTPLGQRHAPQVWAGISLTYSNPGPKEFAFDGQFIAYANVRPAGISLLRGAGAGNIVGNVAIHASKFDNRSEWYLHIGSPESRCGLAIGFEGFLELEANGYFMLGHHLPTTLPVPEEVAFLFGDINSQNGNKLTSGTIDGEKDRSSSSTNNAKNGTGLAFGAEVKVELEIDQFGVYAELGIFLGFDINITKNSGLYCSNTGKEIGINGWYGQGQIYAGLTGGLGFRVRALGKNHDLELFGLSAAMMLSGGGPNPFYADGRVGVQIRVLGGLIKCTKMLSVEVGEKCVPYYPNPFGTVPIIAETYPLDQETDVSHFVQPQISFTLPMDEITEISIMKPNGSFGPYWVEPYFEDVQIINENGGQFPIAEELLLKNGKLLKLDKGRSFKSNKEYSVKLTIKAREYPEGPNGSSRAVEDYGKEWKLDTMFTFTVGELTDIHELIEFAIPLDGQRYFLQDQVYATKLNFIEPHSEAFKQDNENYTFDYFVRYLDEDGNDPIVIPISDPGPGLIEQLDWTLPQFENETHYCMQLIRKQTAISNLAMAQNRILFSDFETIDTQNSVGSRDTIELGAAINPVDDLGAGELALYTYFFKTSKYNTLEDKMAGALSSNNDFAWQTDILTLNTNENFDVYDVKGVKVQTQTIVEPLIRLFDPMEVSSRSVILANTNTPYFDYTDYYEKQLVDKTQVFLDKVADKNLENPLTDGAYVNCYTSDFPEPGLKYMEANAMHRQVIDYDQELGESVIDLFAENEYANMINIANTNLSVQPFYNDSDDVRLEFTTFDKANADAIKLYQWAEDIGQNAVCLWLVEEIYGYTKFVQHYTNLYPSTTYQSRNYIGDTFYLDVYHSNFISTPISSYKGQLAREVKFEIE